MPTLPRALTCRLNTTMMMKRVENRVSEKEEGVNQESGQEQDLHQVDRLGGGEGLAVTTLIKLGQLLDKDKDMDNIGREGRGRGMCAFE